MLVGVSWMRCCVEEVSLGFELYYPLSFMNGILIQFQNVPV